MKTKPIYMLFVAFVSVTSVIVVSGCTTSISSSTPTPSAASTATAIPTKTPTPIPSFKTTPTPTRKPTISKIPTRPPNLSRQPPPTLPPATLAAEATIDAFGKVCEPPAEDWSAEFSPDGNWIAVACRGADSKIDSHLRVVSLDGAHDWAIHFADYARDEYYDHHDMVDAFHWSMDGKYLYASSYSRLDGCCWIGGYRLLVRLNLENGRQDEVLIYDSPFLSLPVPVDISISPNDRYVLYVPQQGDNDIYILDLHTWKQRIIKLEYESTGAGYTIMSEDGNKVALMLREYPEEYQGDLTFGSIVIIDLQNGFQRKVLSGRDFEDTPIPVKWEDNDHILLRHDDQFWLLNIHTADMKEIANP